MKKYERQGGVQNTDFDGIFQHMGEERLTERVTEMEVGDGRFDGEKKE